MGIAEMLDEIKRKALMDKELKKALLETRREQNPVSAFCKKMQGTGI